MMASSRAHHLRSLLSPLGQVQTAAPCCRMFSHRSVWPQPLLVLWLCKVEAGREAGS